MGRSNTFRDKKISWTNYFDGACEKTTLERLLVNRSRSGNTHFPQNYEQEQI
jgi:hypothetical protein